MPTLVIPGWRTRWRIPLILGVTIFVNFLDRNTLSLALPRIAHDFGWSDREVGAHGEWLLGAFFVTYALSNMLFSPVAERFGAKRSVMVAIVAFSLVTILCAPLGQSLTALIGLRLLLGLGEGVHIPMLSAITSRWFPLHERSRANAIWGAGITLSIALAPLFIVPLIQAIGWRLTFAVLGVVGLLLSVPLVAFFVQDHPQQASLSKAELAYIQGGRIPGATASAQSQQKHYGRTPRFWLAVLGGSLNNFCTFGVLNWLPTYFNRAKGIDFDQLGWPLALIFAAGIVGIALMAYLGDKLQQRARLAGVGFLLAAGMVYLAASMNTLGLLVLCFAIAVFFQSTYGAQEYAIVQHLLPPDRVGSGTGLYNGLSVLIGGVGGSFIPGSIVAATGSFDAGILSIVVGAGLAALVMFYLDQQTHY